jgi:PKD repeat protein
MFTNQAQLSDVDSQQMIQIITTARDAPITGLAASNNGPTQLGNATNFSASVTAGTNIIYSWNFGDGSPPKTGASVQHIFPAPGIYPAQVTASNGVSSQTQTTPVTITDAPPLASFFSSTPDKLGQTTTFQSTSSGSNLTYQWNFGDGEATNFGPTPVVTHVYTALGIYTATLTAKNSVGSSVTTRTVSIIPGINSPEASFSSSSPDELGQITHFTNTSQDGGDDVENVSYAWNFGDGATSAAQHPTHTYPALGMYQVALTITNSVGSDTVAGTVTITDASIAELTLTNNSPTPLGSATMLTATLTSGSHVSYTWDFGDGSVPQGGPAVVQHTYPAAGVYTASVTAANGVSSQTQQTVVIIEDAPVEDSPKQIFLPLLLKNSQ